MNPWPGAATRLANGTEPHVWRARATEGVDAPGTILEAGPRWLVAAGDGALELLPASASSTRLLGGRKVVPL